MRADQLSDSAIAHLRSLVDAPASQGARYAIIDQLGEGGMGVVYLAHDCELDRDVALKVLHTPAPNVEEREHILREARILASLEHPGIVPVHDVGSLPDGRLFYVMKCVRGERFDEFARGPHTPSELLRAFLQVCDALAFAHAAGIVHRDLKPQNIMLGAFGEVLVLDWGVAKTRRHSGDVGSNHTDGTAAGTPGYMAPEQRHGAADERADIFGLGGILYFALARSHPPADDRLELTDVPAPLQAICERARAVDPAARYQSVVALAADVANYLDALPVTAHREGLFERARRIGLRHRTAILLVLAYLVVRVALLILAKL